MDKYDPSLGPLSTLAADKRDLEEEKRKRERFHYLHKSLADLLTPYVKDQLSEDSGFGDTDVMIAGTREMLQKIDKAVEKEGEELPQELLYELGEDLDTVEAAMNTDPEGFAEDAELKSIQDLSNSISTLFLSQFTVEVYGEQDGNLIELSPETFLPYGKEFYKENISRSGWDEETYKRTITTCMQKLLEQTNDDLELPSGQRVRKQDDRYFVVSIN